jgi:hypothetical protein
MRLGNFVLLNVAALTFVSCVVGCGQVEKETKSGASLSREIRHLTQGMSVEMVESRLGEPKAEQSTGNADALSYGIWQLTFVRNHLATRSKVIVPSKSRRAMRGHEVNKVVRQLKLGAKIGVVEAKLGDPEVVYVIYEGDPQPVKVLRYGSWQLTFVHRKLSQRAQ